MTRRYVIRATDVAAYSPANHTGTSNQRIIGRETVGAEYVEVLIGTITKGNGALKHAHPTLEQASLIFEGAVASEIGGVERELHPGDWVFNAQGVFHCVNVISETPLKVLVIYAPPYSENPNAAVLFDVSSPDPQVKQRGHDEQPRFVPRDHNHTATSYRPVITGATDGAAHMAIFDAHMAAGAEARRQALADVEQVLFLRSGALAGFIEDAAFEAKAGDFVFIPDGAMHEYRAVGDTQAYVIHAFGAAS